jgi:hypothetical protein
MQSAQKISLERCRSAVLLSAQAAYNMNSSYSTMPEDILKALIIDLAAGKQVSAL